MKNLIKLLILIGSIFAIISCGAGSGGNTSTPSGSPTPNPTTVPVVDTTGIPNFGVVLDGYITRSAQPDAIGLANLKKAGVTEILKLNTTVEYSQSLEEQQFGGTVVYGPVSLNVINCNQVESLADWLEQQVKNGAWVHVHCTKGVDRAGAVIGAWKLKYGGFTYTQVTADWKIYGVMNQGFVKCLKAIVPVK